MAEADQARAMLLATLTLLATQAVDPGPPHTTFERGGVATVFDAQLVMPEAQRVVELVRSTGKKLAFVWVTHAPPDHAAGLEAIATAFPGVPIYAQPTTATDVPLLLKKFEAPLQKSFPGEMTTAPPPITPWTKDTLEVGGVTLQIVDVKGGEHPTSTMIVIPSLRAALIGDLVYNRVHPWLNELDDVGVFKHVDMLAGLDTVDTFYPGHGEPFSKDFLPVYRRYVTDFLAEVPQAKDGADLIERVWRRHPDWRTMAGLRFSANAYMGARTPSP